MQIIRQFNFSRRLAVGALTLCGLALAAPSQAGVEIDVKTTYYDVRGKSIESLDESIYRNAPLLNGKERALGQARLKFDANIDAEMTNRGCAVTDPNVSLDIVVTLPRWRGHNKADAGLQRLWSNFYGFVKRHEERHAEIAMKHAKMLERVFSNVPTAPNCKLLRARLMAGAKRILTQHKNAQERFDANEQARMRRAARMVATRRPRASSAN